MKPEKLAALLLACLVALFTFSTRVNAQENIPAPEIQRIPAERLREMLASGEAIAVDVRGENDFLNGHVRGALHLPGDNFEAFVKTLPRDKTIVTYCT